MMPTPVPLAKIRRAVISAVIGNGLEWYDFMVYGFFSQIIAKTFFPTHDPFVTSLVGGATFAIAYFVRPLSGVVIGLYADRFGRKPALTLMILMMGISTLTIGLTPPYAWIGMTASVLVILARVLQGISVGGEFASATAVLAEYAPPGKKMYYGSFQMCSQAVALALSSAAGFATAALMSEDALNSWGWRLPFILGALVTPIGFYIRRHVDETPEFAEMLAQKKVAKAPLSTVFTTYFVNLIMGTGTIIIATISVYVWFITLPRFIIDTLKLPPSGIMLSNVFCGLILFVLTPYTGRLADRYGALKIWTIGVVAYGLLAYPILSWVVSEPSFTHMLIGQGVGGVAIALIWGPYPGQMATYFPVNIRSTGMAISYNVGVLLFGGLAPLNTSILTRLTGSNMVSAWYIIVGAVLSLLAVWVPTLLRKNDLPVATETN